MTRLHESRHVYWQTALAVLLGVITGIVLMTFLHRGKAIAMPKFDLIARAGKTIDIPILPRLEQHMNVLVMGVDSNGVNTDRFAGTRSDTMILVSLDPVEHKVGLVSIPRDSKVDIPDHKRQDKINAAHAYGGAELSVRAVQQAFGVPVCHYVEVDTQGLKQLCQLLGPVDVLVEKEMHYHDWSAHLHIDLKPGLQTLSPEQVEQYVRFRHDARGDIGRIERQQWFFRQAAQKLKDPQFLLKLPELIKLGYDCVHTNLGIDDVARIAAFAKDIKPQNVITATLPGEAATIDGCSYWLPNMEACHTVFNRILGLSSSDYTIASASADTSTNSSGSGTTGGTASGTADANPDGSAQPKLDPLGTLAGTSEPVDQAAIDKAVAESQKPMSFAIKYPSGCETVANDLEQLLLENGYRVRYKWKSPTGDCQHEQVVQMSVRANDGVTSTLREHIRDLRTWPVTIALEHRPCADFMLIVSPRTTLTTIKTAKATATGSRKPVMIND